METEQINKAIENLKNGFFGYAEIVVEFKNDNYYLVKTEIADPAEGWECAEYHLLKKDLSESHYLANCDGYNGVQYQMDDAKIEGLGIDTEDLDEYVLSYDITGDLLAEARLAKTTEADETYEGECKIWVEYCYSAGTLNHPNDGFVNDDNSENMIFESYEAAENWIDEMNEGTYYLSHGEMGSPSYKIIEA